MARPTTADKKRAAYLRRIPAPTRALNKLYAKQRRDIGPRDIVNGKLSTSARARMELEFIEWLKHPAFKGAWDSGAKLNQSRIDQAFDEYVARRAILFAPGLANTNASAVSQLFIINSDTSRKAFMLDLKNSGAIGLHPRQVKALSKQMEKIRGLVPEGKVAMWERRLTNQKLEYRANLVARTEMGNASNAAQLDGQLAKIEAGEASPNTKKAWSTTGKNTVCPMCEANEMEGFIPMDQEFSSGHDRPLAHPQCQCAIQFSAREPEGIVKPVPPAWNNAQPMSTAAVTGLTTSAARHILEKRGMARAFLLRLERADVDDLLTKPEFTGASMSALLNKYDFPVVPIQRRIKRKPQSAVDRLPF